MKDIEKLVLDQYGCKTKQELQDYLGEFVSVQMIIEVGKKAYNQAIDGAAENAEVKASDQKPLEQGLNFISFFEVDKQSILKLKK